MLQALNVEEDAGAGLRWQCARIIDTEPVLRLQADGELFSEQYGHPCQRRIHASTIPPLRFEAILVSFFEHALQDCEPRLGGWEWTDMHAYNKALDFAQWSKTGLAQTGISRQMHSDV